MKDKNPINAINDSLDEVMFCAMDEATLRKLLASS